MSEKEADSLGEDGMSEEDQNRRRLERAGWTNGDLSLSLLLLLKKRTLFALECFPHRPVVGVSFFHTVWTRWGVVGVLRLRSESLRGRWRGRV